MIAIRERIEITREAVELFPRCVKCDGDLRGERLSNLVPVLGRDRRHAHHACPRSAPPVGPEGDHAA